ncbi:MAG TPA: class III extradiol ring-cleavage dioxygenase [Gallionellaceae bacterium]|nr:class III extradiol ring-cleavage dioxygenase [Gallionellaceae bacterium]
MRQPALFLSHGAPTFMLEENATTRFWQSLPALLPEKPSAVLCVSAHWDAPQLRISGTLGKTGIQHDFYGFPSELYDISWDEHEDAETSAGLLRRLRQLHVEVAEDSRPKDHGVWVPLKTAWPEPDFPVYQLSLNLAQGLDSHWSLGQKLQALRDEGVLIIGSGGITHNLRSLEWNAAEDSTVPWAAAFVEAVEQAIASNDRAALCQPWQFPYGRECHPTIEHYAPLLVVMGAAGSEPVKALHRSWRYGNFALNAYGTVL